MPGQAAALHAAIPKDSIETAYCFLHQKRNVYIHSSLDWQKDDIEYAIASYAESMNQQLYDALSGGRPDFLREHRPWNCWRVSTIRTRKRERIRERTKIRIFFCT